MNVQTFKKKADYIGIAGSVLCLVHCLAAPLLVMTSTLLRDDTLRTSFLGLDYVFIGVNIVAVYFATRHAASSGIRLALWGFLLLFATGLLLEDAGPAFQYLAYAASAGLVGSHLLNLRRHHAQRLRNAH